MKDRDLVYFEISASKWRYAAALMRTIFIGQPSDRQRRCAEAVIGAVDKAIETIRAGVTAEEVEVVAFIDEEGAYLSLLGSRGMVGRLTADEVTTAVDSDGRTLSEAMRAVGLDPTRALAGARPAQDFRGYVELHIEQGPVLERLGIPIGVVDGIVGVAEIDYRFIGSADHAGTTPMEMRRDAFRAAAEFTTCAYERFAAIGAEHSRMTLGVAQVRPNVANIVPREVYLALGPTRLVCGPPHAPDRGEPPARP